MRGSVIRPLFEFSLANTHGDGSSFSLPSSGSGFLISRYLFWRVPGGSVLAAGGDVGGKTNRARAFNLVSNGEGFPLKNRHRSTS